MNVRGIIMKIFHIKTALIIFDHELNKVIRKGDGLLFISGPALLPVLPSEQSLSLR